MAHVAKYNKTQVGGLVRHFERAKVKETGEYIKFSNQEIDVSRIHLNYNLAKNKNQLKFINQRCSEVKCLNRKDVNVMCGWIITLPKDLKNEKDEKRFFEECYKFLNYRYGEQNVISAYVHKDETTPHMHYAFIPIVKDKKLGIEKVSAKELLNKKDLQSFHNDLDNHMKQVFGRDIGILNDATKEGNKSIKELKRKSAIERLSEVDKIAEQKLSDTDKILNNASVKLSDMRSDINILTDDKNALEKQIDIYNKTLDTYADIDSIGSKNIFGKVTMSLDDSNKLKEQAKSYFSEHSKNYNLEKQNKQLLYDNKIMQNELSTLNSKYKALDKKLSQIIHTLKSNPDLVNKFNKQIEINRQREEQELKMHEKFMHERSKKLNSIKRDDLSR